MTGSKACSLLTPDEGTYKNAEYHFHDCPRLIKFCANHKSVKMRELRSHEEAKEDDIPFCEDCLKEQKKGRKHVKAIEASGFGDYPAARKYFALPARLYVVHIDRDCPVFVEELKGASTLLRQPREALLEALHRYDDPYIARDDDGHHPCHRCLPNS